MGNIYVSEQWESGGRDCGAGRARLSYTLRAGSGEGEGVRGETWGGRERLGGRKRVLLLEQRNRERGCAGTLRGSSRREGNGCGREGGQPGSAGLGLLPPALKTAFLGHPANVNEARFLCMR